MILDDLMSLFFPPLFFFSLPSPLVYPLFFIIISPPFTSFVLFTFLFTLSSLLFFLFSFLRFLFPSSSTSPYLVFLSSTVSRTSIFLFLLIVFLPLSFFSLPTRTFSFSCGLSFHPVCSCQLFLPSLNPPSSSSPCLLFLFLFLSNSVHVHHQANLSQTPPAQLNSHTWHSGERRRGKQMEASSDVTSLPRYTCVIKGQMLFYVPHEVDEQRHHQRTVRDVQCFCCPWCLFAENFSKTNWTNVMAMSTVSLFNP